MNIGAKFHKCDLQVHTPRDENFKGKEYITDEERYLYAKAFIKACREKEIDAVAITDHHDLGFFNYIKKASIDEVDENENLVQEEKRIIVFPGMELTLEVPCQALLIFDADLEINDETRIQIYTALKIQDHTKVDEPNTAKTVRLPFEKISEVVAELEAQDKLKGKFIIFPNIKSSGRDTILRHGCHAKYAKGNFIGGYLDKGLYEKHKNDPGWNNIINGKTEAYGNKSIAVIQTSDNRTDTFEHLGISASWIKWSEPTAEGLRQACLAKNTRIMQEKPDLPNTYIKSINIKNSSYLGDISLLFNPQLNVFIGGRGTGKSSMLQYLSWALGKDKNDKQNNELVDFVSNTLKNGLIAIEIIKNNVVHKIERTLTKLRLKIGDGEWKDEDPNNVATIIQTESYAQKELSKFGKDRTQQIKELIKYSKQIELQRIDEKLKENANKIFEIFAKLETYYEKEKRLSEIITRASSIMQQMENLQSTFISIPPEDKKTIENNKFIEQEKDILKKIISEKDDVTRLLQTLLGNAKVKNIDGIPDILLNKDEITLLFEIYNSIIMNIKEKIEEGLAYAKSTELDNCINRIQKLHIDFDNRYNKAITTTDVVEKNLNQYNELNNELKLLTEEIVQLKDYCIKNEFTEKKIMELYFERNILNMESHKLTEIGKNEIVKKSDGQLLIEITELENYKSILREFIETCSSSKGQPERTAKFFENFKSKKLTYKKLLKFWFILYMAKKKESNDLSIDLNKYGIDNQELLPGDYLRILSSFDIRKIIEFSLKLPEYYLNIKYCKDRNNTIPFDEASYGQQAGAILTVLLNQQTGPLIIDQPEDDLDNKVIQQITENINKAKSKRQMIFSSHNANIAVNGDAELILCFEHNSATSKGEINTKGSIDNIKVKETIKDVMEGGEKAFTLRKEKYGF